MNSGILLPLSKTYRKSALLSRGVRENFFKALVKPRLCIRKWNSTKNMGHLSSQKSSTVPI